MSRLKQTDWIAAGFRALTTKGPQALKAEPLARDLGTTKGSFYWHFKDVPAFQEQMLSHWEEKATQNIIVALDPIPTPAAKLRALSQLATTPQGNYGGVGAEPAIRAWARADKNVAAALARVDTTRLAYLQEIFTAMDMANPDLPRICYASLIGLQELSDDCDSTGTTPMATLVDLMIALAKTD